jgi:hypothetical protein
VGKRWHAVNGSPLHRVQFHLLLVFASGAPYRGPPAETGSQDTRSLDTPAFKPVPRTAAECLVPMICFGGFGVRLHHDFPCRGHRVLTVLTVLGRLLGIGVGRRRRCHL